MKQTIDIAIDASAPEPVYEQIVRQIQSAVSTGALDAGTPLPTVRQLATDLVLNRNTVARAYKLLEDQGVIQTAGRKGSFVRTGAADEVDRLKRGQAERALRQTIARLIARGLSLDEIDHLFRAAIAAAGRV